MPKRSIFEISNTTRAAQSFCQHDSHFFVNTTPSLCDTNADISMPDTGNEMNDQSLQKSPSELSDLSDACEGPIKDARQRPPPPPRRWSSRSVASRHTVSSCRSKSFSKKIGLRQDFDMSMSKAIGLRNGARGGRRLSKEEQEFQAYRKFRDSQLRRNSRDRSKSPGRNRNYLGLRPSQKELRERRASRYVSS